MAKKEKATAVSKDMTIRECLKTYPKAEKILYDLGLKCVELKCYVAIWETLEEGLKGHGHSEEKIQQVLKQIAEA